MRPTKCNLHHYAVLPKQHGGTLIGIIIGLVIGLGIALAVALIITKTPAPFMDKSGRATRTEANTSQPFDPNKPLYTNRGAGREAQKAETKQVDPNPPINIAAQPPSKPAPVPVPVAEAPKAGQTAPTAPTAPATPAAGKDPIAAIAGAESKPAEAAEEKFLYYLQAGAFRDQADAEAMRGKLALAGVEAKTSERNSESGVMYRVRVGPFNNLDALNKVRGKVSEAGVDAAVLRVAK